MIGKREKIYWKRYYCHYNNASISINVTGIITYFELMFEIETRWMRERRSILRYINAFFSKVDSF